MSALRSHPPPGARGGPTHPRARRVVLWTSLSTAGLVAALIAVLASAGPASQVVTPSPLIGKAAPPIAGPALEGGATYRLSQFAGKWVLVNFAASWCVPCRQEMPQLLSFAHDHAASGNATILTVADDQGDAAHLASFLASLHASWPAVDDAAAVVNWGVGQIPESYLVDPSGTVVGKYFGSIDANQLNAFIATFSSPPGSG